MNLLFGTHKKKNETEEYKYSFPNSVLHVWDILNELQSNLKEQLKVPKQTRWLKMQ